jgi:hypothetical protein
MAAFQDNQQDLCDPSRLEEEDNMVEGIVDVVQREPTLVGLAVGHAVENYAEAGLVVADSELDEWGHVDLDSEELGVYPVHNDQ